jgi:hypothetical protein
MKSNCLSLSAILTALLGFLFAVTPVLSQSQNKVLEWSKFPVGSNNESAAASIQLSRQIDGIEIEDILVDGKSITIGEAFAADIDWIRNIRFRVKNISGEQLMGIQITVTLPEMNKSPQIPFIYGCAHNKSEKCLVPGDEVELKLPPGRLYDWVKDSVAKERDISMISKAMIHDMLVTLPNGMQWLSGCIKTADPKNACPHTSP